MADLPRSISLENGKYEVIERAPGRLLFLRYGEPWPAAQQNYEHSKLIYAMFSMIHNLSKAVSAAS